MGITDTAAALAGKLRLDSHHAIERFGVMVGILVVLGVLVTGGAAVAALRTGAATLTTQAVHTTGFTTSKTGLKGTVDGVYTNRGRTRALVMMHFEDRARISYTAADYRAFLLGSDRELGTHPVDTPGLTGRFLVFGSTGYLGVLLEARQSFAPQVLNLTVRATQELSSDRNARSGAEETPSDATFTKYDQWAIYLNPGGSDAPVIPALDRPTLDPAQAYYDVVLVHREAEIKAKLDAKLAEMRTHQAQIAASTADLATTRADGLSLWAPRVPAAIATDRITGATAAQNRGTSTLALETDHVVPGGVALNWRDGNVYTGYLPRLVPPGQSYVQFLAAKRDEGSDDTTRQLSEMAWILSDGTDLKKDYPVTDVTMRPLTTVMNNLAQAYSDYAKAKSTYQSDLLIDLLRLEVQVRDIRANGSTHTEGVLTVLY
ncbi:hypothetical protein [Granulicoccus phenolivorans]|uniref:hypothetical protein n=1 Tax=Granulicoccus phenolivorans TaxID=266854 RepID=UPI000420F9A0|nr:hypothetical protein [Granulicoccus phenolivorans]